MNIQLQELHMRHFKGVRSLDLKFGSVTNICGANGLGKTSIFDAFLWLLFGKDSTDRKDFNIKTLDAGGQPMQKLEHEVSAVLYADGQRIELRRVYKEKWEKKRGALDAEMTGHEQLFFWNDVPMKAGEYAAKVGALMEESLFKLITNPFAFNSLKWQERRQVLVAMAGGITPAEVLNRFVKPGELESFDLLVSTINSGKSLAEWKSQLVAQKKKLKEQLQQIPARIDEATRAIPEDLDFNDLRIQQARLEAAITEIDEQLQSVVAQQQAQSKAFTDRQSRIFTIRRELDAIKYRIESDAKSSSRQRAQELQQAQRELADHRQRVTQLEESRSENARQVASLEERIRSARAEWSRVNEEQLTFAQDQFCCPACSTPFAPELVEEKKLELTTNFNTNKAERLADINAKGKRMASELEALNQQAKRIQATLESFSVIEADAVKMIEELSAPVDARAETPEAILEACSADATYNTLTDELSELQALQAAAGTDAVPDFTAQKEKKAGLVKELDAVKLQLARESSIEAGNKRVQQLQQEERTYAQQLAELEGQEYLLEQYNRASIDLLEERINGKFRHVRFKMFERQINGGEVECCEALVNGVPFSDANNAAKVNAGIDIINALCAHYQVAAPIFIDNRESVNELIACSSQIINLIVTQDKQLKVA